MANDTPSPNEFGVTHQRLLPENTNQPEDEQEDRNQEEPIRIEGSTEHTLWLEAERLRREIHELDQAYQERLQELAQEEERSQREEQKRVLDTEARRWRNLHFQEEQERIAEERQQRQLRLEAEAKDQAAARIRLRIISSVIWVTLTILSIALFGLLLSVAFNYSDFTLYGLSINRLRNLSIATILIFAPLIIILLSSRASDAPDKQLNNLLQEREKITRKIEKETKQDIFYTIQLNLNQLTEYYTINKKQAKNSFNFSIGAASAGLITIFGGVWFYYIKFNNIPISYITSIAGVILEFIGGAYFFVYKKSLEQVNLFFNQLVINQDTMLAIELAKLNRNTRKRSVTQEKIISSLLERSKK